MSFTEALTVNQEKEIKGDQNYQPEEHFVFDYTFLPVCVSCPRKKQTNKQTNKKTANKQTKKQPNPNQIKKTNNTEKHTLLGADSAEILSGKSSQGEVIFAA